MPRRSQCRSRSASPTPGRLPFPRQLCRFPPYAAYILYLSMILSENRFPFSGIMLLKVLHKARFDQQAVEASRLSAVLARIKQALAAEHDVLLLLEGGIERDAGGFLDHQRQIGCIDRVHDRRALHGLEVHGIDGVVGREIARIVAVELAGEAGFVEAGI